MHTLISFIQTVAAQVVACYLCSWIDGKIGKGSKHEKKPPRYSEYRGLRFWLESLENAHLIAYPYYMQKSKWSEKFNTCPSGELANP